MKMPGADPKAVAVFESLRPKDPSVEVRKMFGQPAAFVGGHLCYGVFGGDVFVRLSEKECTLALGEPGMRPFEPMAGRAMRGYVVLSLQVREDPHRARDWVERSVRFVATLPSKVRASNAGAPAPRVRARGSSARRP